MQGPEEKMGLGGNTAAQALAMNTLLSTSVANENASSDFSIIDFNKSLATRINL